MLLACLSLATAEPASSAEVSSGEESEFVGHLNAQRSAAGLPALTVDPELTSASRSWSQSMTSAGEISHANPISAGITSAWERLGENVGVGPSVESVMDAFMNSSGHRANILNPEFTHVGVGVVRDGAVLYTTHRFMKLFEAPATSPPTAAPAPAPAPTAAASPPLAAAPAPETATVTTTTAPTNPITTSTAPPKPLAPTPEQDVRPRPIASSADRAGVDDLMAALVAVSSEH
ncbi:MAG: hypothetical protein IH940_12620 [Acidobacteria bacterium]|nr:hypothetical protein [Acidobacteriota bacterium]